MAGIYPGFLASSADLGVGRGGRGYPFSFEILYFCFLEFRLRKMKSISAIELLSVPITPFWIFWIRPWPAFGYWQMQVKEKDNSKTALQFIMTIPVKSNALRINKRTC